MSNVAKKLSLPRWSQLPEIPLYLDQVLTVVHEITKPYMLIGEKPLTGAMVNNYVKQGLIEPPVKKKYQRDHVARLIVITAFKRCFSIPEIQLLLDMQVRFYPAYHAYDYLITELESALEFPFLDGAHFKQNAAQWTDDTRLVRAMVLAFASTIYVQQKLIQSQQQEKKADEGAALSDAEHNPKAETQE